jgi:hypothetical protein
MDEANAYYPPGLPLPTVAHDRAHGITSLRFYGAEGNLIRLARPHEAA